MWQLEEDLSKPDIMRQCLARAFESASDVDKIMDAAATKEVKDKLLAVTDDALASGAYGCPWFVVENAEGKKEPFFGSDRWHFMWEYLGVDWTDVKIVEKAAL
jgi:glutathione S-transferase kappa 1